MVERNHSAASRRERGRRVRSAFVARTPSARGCRRSRGGRTVSPRRTRRWDDAAREAALEDRSRRDRPAGRAATVRLRDRLGDERQDHDRRNGRGDLAGPVPARPQRGRCQPRLGRRLDAAGGRQRRARAVRGRRGRPARGHAAGCSSRGLPREPLPRPARPLRRARAGGRGLARDGRRTGGRHTLRERRRSSACRSGSPGGRQARARLRDRRSPPCACPRCSTRPTRSTA